MLLRPYKSVTWFESRGIVSRQVSRVMQNSLTGFLPFGKTAISIEHKGCKVALCSYIHLSSDKGEMQGRHERFIVSLWIMSQRLIQWNNCSMSRRNCV